MDERTRKLVKAAKELTAAIGDNKHLASLIAKRDEVAARRDGDGRALIDRDPSVRAELDALDKSILEHRETHQGEHHRDPEPQLTPEEQKEVDGLFAIATEITGRIDSRLVLPDAEKQRAGAAFARIEEILAGARRRNVS